MTETREIRMKRVRLRSWRRGTREMDLILGPYADGPLGDAPDPELDAWEAMLEEPDPDLYNWITGTLPAPAEHGPTIRRIRAFHRIG